MFFDVPRWLISIPTSLIRLVKCNLSNNRFYKNKTWSTDNLHMFGKHCKASKQCMILKWWAQNTPMKWMKEQAVEILKLALCQSQ